MQWDGEAVERVVRDEGGAIAVVRTADEWRAHPVGRRPAAKPVVEMTKIGDSDPVVLPKGGELPLTGLKVLDNTHVIGGPITTRTLAEFGAEMLHLSHPATPDHMNWRLETDIGKRAAYCDLDDGSGQAQLFPAAAGRRRIRVLLPNMENMGIALPSGGRETGIIAHELRCFDLEGEWANIRAST